MGALEDVVHLRVRRHRPEALGLDGPQHETLAVASERAEERRVQHPPGRAEVAWRVAGEVAEELVGARHLALGRARAEKPEAPVGPGVARHPRARPRAWPGRVP